MSSVIGVRVIFIIFAVVISLLLVKSVFSVQKSFTLDLSNQTFRYEGYAFNDSDTSKDMIFSGNQNITAYITIPKNSTLLNSTLTLTGKITPSQTYGTGVAYYSVAIGNVTSSPENEIAIGRLSSIVLLNSSLNEVWNYSTGSGEAYGVAIGNVTSDSGEEVAISSGDTYVYLLNSSGNLIWKYSTGDEVKGIAIGDVFSANGNEVVAVSGQKVYVLNSSGNQVWNYSTSGTAYSVAVGDVTSDLGSEVAVGDNSKVYLLNSSGNQVWNYSADGLVRGIAVGDVTSDLGSEVVAVTNGGTIYVINSTGNTKWTYNIGSAAYGVAVGDVTSDVGSEIAIGSADNKIYVLNSSGYLVWSYTTGNVVRGVAVGNITADPLNETIAVSMDKNLYILNFEYYPTDLSIDIGGDGDYDWSYSGKFRTTMNVNDSNSNVTRETQDFLSSCSSKNCNVTFVFHSSASGELNVSNINITYGYNTTDIISYQLLSDTWSRTNNTRVNESVGYQVKNVSYTDNPASGVEIRYIRINESATLCDFGGVQYNNKTIDDVNYCNISYYTINSSGALPSSSLLWDNTMPNSTAMFMNESAHAIDGYLWKKNVTIWNETTTIFYNITANATMNESYVVSNSRLRANWYENETFYDITPAASSSDCNTNNPTYSSVSVGPDSFYVCKQDTNSNGVVEYFKWKQPSTFNRTAIIYELSGSSNSPPTYKDANVTPFSAIWGSNFNFSVFFNDTDVDNITVRLLLNVTNLNTWINEGEENITGNGTVWFYINSNKSWTGINSFKFEYRDFNSSSGEAFHDWQNTTEHTGPNVTRHNVSIIYVQGNNIQINRTGINNSTLLVVQINDTDNATLVEDGVACGFWITTDGNNFDSGYFTTTNYTGYCNYSFQPNSSYSPGQQYWKTGVYSDSYYLDKNSTNYSSQIYGLLSINLTSANSNFTRGVNSTLEARLLDEFDSVVPVSGYDCNWYVNDGLIGNSNTNSTGYCNYAWITSCSNSLGNYSINVTLSGGVSSYYYNDVVNSFGNSTLKDRLNVSMILPLNNSIVHEQETINLNSTVNDSCGVPGYSYSIAWYSPSLDSPPCPNSNPVATGDNTSWTLSPNCKPSSRTIIANATGDLYTSDQKNVSIYLYGWAEINLTSPSSGTFNRTEGITTLDIVCSVVDADLAAPNNGIQNYLVRFWNGEDYMGFNTTNSTGYAKYVWNISSNYTVPEGSYTIKCNITDNSTLYYNASISSSNVSIYILDVDVNPPIFTGVSSSSVLPNNNVTIFANVSDCCGVDKVWFNITYPNGTNFTYTMQNNSLTTWNYTLVNLSAIGDYDYTIFANDSSNNTNSTRGWFEVYLPAQLIGNATDAEGRNVSMNLIFYREGKSDIVHEYNTSSSNVEYNFSIRRRIYDLEVDVFGHKIKFNSLNTTNSTNMTNVLNFTNFSTTLVDGPEAYRHKLVVLDVKTNLTYQNVTLTLNYSSYVGPVEFEPAVTAYKCSNFIYPSTCASGWIKIANLAGDNSDNSINTTLHTITANVSSTSAFFVLERSVCGNHLQDPGETCSNCPQDLSNCPTGGLTGDGGGGGGGGTICGNGICESGENKDNCPQDCGGLTFSVRTNLTDVQIDPGDKRMYALWIKNNINQKSNVSISVTGSASQFIDLEKNFVLLEGDKEEVLRMDVDIPANTETGTYTGEISITGGTGTSSIPVRIYISSKGASYLDVAVTALTKSVTPNENAKFHVVIYNLGLRKKLEVNLTYDLKEIRTDKIVFHESEHRPIETTESFVKNIPIADNAILGDYIVTVSAVYGNRTVSSTDTFSVVRPFWTAERIKYSAIIAFIALSVASVFYGRRFYIIWKLSKARYIFPVNYGKLPSGKFWLGKIAETDKKSYFNPDDLTTHVLVAGSTGSGKSVTGNIFIEEALEQKYPVVVFDPTAQWTGFVRPCQDEKIFKYYKKFGFDKRSAKPFKGIIYEVTNPNVEIELKKYMNPGEITVFTLNKLKPGQYDEAVIRIIDSIFDQGWEESTTLKMIVVFDEVHRLLEKYGGKGGYVALERACREFRKWGIGLVMISQVLSDFKEAIKGNVLTEIQMHTKSLEDLERIEKKYGLEYSKRVAREEVGIGMVQNPGYNDGRPWFISFRPPLHSPHKIPEKEFETYKEYVILLDELEKKILKLEEEGIDTFSLKIELKLARDKLKEGRFRMSKIYIDSLSKKLSK
jgi:hypothetical protein